MQKTIFKKFWKGILLIVFVLLLLFLIGIYFYNFGEYGLSNNPQDWSAFGGYMAGVFTFASFIAVVYIALLVKNYESKKVITDIKRQELKEFCDISTIVITYLYSDLHDDIQRLRHELLLLMHIPITYVSFSEEIGIKFIQLSDSAKRLRELLRKNERTLKTRSDASSEFQEILGLKENSSHANHSKNDRGSLMEILSNLLINFSIHTISDDTINSNLKPAIEEFGRIMINLIKLLKQDLIQSTKL